MPIGVSTGFFLRPNGVSLRPGTAFPSQLARSSELIDAAIAVNAAPSLMAAFQVLADTGIDLLGADRLSVLLWDEKCRTGTVVAGAGTAAGDVGSTISGDDATRDAVASGEAFSTAPTGGTLTREAHAHIAGLATLVRLPLVTGSIRATFQAGWSVALDAEELDEATNLLRTLMKLTSLAERSLREHERIRLDVVLERVADGVIVASPSGVTLNAAARAILGLDESTPFDSTLFSPRTLDGEPYAISPGQQPGHYLDPASPPDRFRIRATSLDGRELVIDGSIAPAGDGSVIVFRDVTEEHARAVLNERYLYELFNSLPIPLTVGYASSRQVVSANQAFLDLTGYDREEIEGVAPPFPWWDPSEDVREGFDPGSVVQRVYRRKDGRPVAVQVASHGIHGHDGEIALLLGVVTDLSEKRRLDSQLVQSGKLAAIGELAAGVAHEINNPLFAILGLTEFLLKESEPGSRAQQRLELIQQTGLEIKEIVRALLDFARENAEDRHVVTLDEVVQSTVDLVRRTNAHKGVELIDGYDDLGTRVHASPNQLKQILLNLIANARQAMPLGGTVRVTVRRDGDSALVLVEDDGPGIEPHVLERMFEPFFTTKRVTGGTGLGLSVSLGIAEAHGGSLTAASEPGRGATFTLCLPVAEEDDE
jgi:PAS domain S-box-containing protein